MKYKKTELGKQTFKAHNNVLSVRQRSAFILFDGEKDDAFIFKALAGTGLNSDDVAHLIAAGLIEAAEATSPAQAKTKPAESLTDFVAPSAQDGATTVSDQDRYQRAYPVAIKLTSGLGLRGFRLNMSVESASNYSDLLALAPKIRIAVGDEKFAELARVLRTT
jgi:hypothetical protein